MTMASDVENRKNYRLSYLHMWISYLIGLHHNVSRSWQAVTQGPTSSARISISAWSTLSSCQLPCLMTERSGNILKVVPRRRQTWIRQLEIDVRLVADAAWATAGDRDVWRAQRPIAGQAVQWVSQRKWNLTSHRSEIHGRTQNCLRLRLFRHL